MSGSYFYEWLFGAKNFSGLSRNGQMVMVRGRLVLVDADGLENFARFWLRGFCKNSEKRDNSTAEEFFFLDNLSHLDSLFGLLVITALHVEPGIYSRQH